MSDRAEVQQESSATMQGFVVYFVLFIAGVITEITGFAYLLFPGWVPADNVYISIIISVLIVLFGYLELKVGALGCALIAKPLSSRCSTK